MLDGFDAFLARSDEQNIAVYGDTIAAAAGKFYHAVERLSTLFPTGADHFAVCEDFAFYLHPGGVRFV